MKAIADFLDNFAQPFQLESTNFKGRIVRLGSALDLILHQHAYPNAVGELLGEATVIAAALGTALKFEGIFTLQAKGDGPVRMLVADVTHDGGLRAYAQFSADRLTANVAGTRKLLGKGHLAFTVDQARKDDRYQGIVALEEGTLAEAVQHYFRQSEQLPTGIVSAVTKDDQGRWRAGCLMLQQMPRDGGIAFTADTSVEDDWFRAMMLMGTCSQDELTDPNLSADDLLYRLFHEEGVRVFEPQLFRHQCRCSEVRVTKMLQSLPRKEIEDLAVDHIVAVTCEFCNRTYKFDEEQIDQLYRDAENAGPVTEN